MTRLSSLFVFVNRILFVLLVRISAAQGQSSSLAQQWGLKKMCNSLLLAALSPAAKMNRFSLGYSCYVAIRDVKKIFFSSKRFRKKCTTYDGEINGETFNSFCKYITLINRFFFTSTDITTFILKFL
jgi:hypothetical protein